MVEKAECFLGFFFYLAGLEKKRKLGTTTVVLCCNFLLPMPVEHKPSALQTKTESCLAGFGRN